MGRYKGKKVIFSPHVHITGDAEQTYENILSETFGTITYTITNTITNGTASGDSTISENGTATITLTANSGYELPSTITVSGASYTYDSTTGVVTLTNPTANVTITAICEATVSE